MMRRAERTPVQQRLPVREQSERIIAQSDERLKYDESQIEAYRDVIGIIQRCQPLRLSVLMMQMFHIHYQQDAKIQYFPASANKNANSFFLNYRPHFNSINVISGLCPRRPAKPMYPAPRDT